MSEQDQLGAIDSLGGALDRRGVEHWLFGGWAVDFWVGEVTRPHDDIDIAAWRRDYDVIREALEDAGWQHTPRPDDMVGTCYRWRSAEVEFTFVEADGEGRVVVPIPGQPVVWAPEPFGDIRRTLLGVSCRILPLPLLRDGKASPRPEAAEGAKDRADFAALSTVDLYEM